MKEKVWYAIEKHYMECLKDIKDNLPSDWEYVDNSENECPSYKINKFEIFIDHLEPHKRNGKMFQDTHLQETDWRFLITAINEDDCIEKVALFNDLKYVLDFINQN
tara:strand:- start:44 stop:361 length:318 start_codon:yes stop_codon:yes gene_type:complete